MQTTVKWFNTGKGYGFLENGAGPDIYVNAKSLRGTDKVATGDLVEFECHVFEGKLVARHVRPLRSEGNAKKGNLNHEKGNGNSYSHGNNHGNSQDNAGNRQQYPNRGQMPRFVMQ